MARRNLTVQLDESIIRRAKVVAAKRGSSVSALVAAQLEELVDDDARYEEARERALDYLRHPSARGGRGWKREDLYDRPVMTRG